MELSVVTTLYFSEPYLSEFYTRLKSVLTELGLSHEIIFVDDGSPDQSLNVALELQSLDSSIKIIELSRNFGHQRAIMTGLLYTTGQYVFLIDCDLEEAPEVLKEFWVKIRHSEFDVVYGVQPKRKGGWFERVSGRLFYNLLSLLSSVDYPADTLTARVMNRKYVDAIVRHQEKELDVWGIFVLAGFKQLPLQVPKGFRGKSTFTLLKKIKRAIEVITSFSHRPLYFTFILGLLCFFISFFNLVVIAYKKLILGVAVEGWASILASVWFVGGMVLLVLGIFGIYLSKMFLEIKNRPLTIVRNVFAK